MPFVRHSLRSPMVGALVGALVAALMFAVASWTSVARGASTTVVIQAAVADLEAGLLTLTGTGFDTRQDTIVELAGAPLVIQSEVATEVVALLPSGIAPGSYLVEVTVTGGTYRQDEFDLTITNEQALQAQVEALAATITAQGSQIAALQAILAGVSRSVDPQTNVDTILVEGVNLQVVNGEGVTLSANGAGNVIIGYNATSTGASARTGSHNLVIGDDHRYVTVASIVAGLGHLVDAPYAAAIGGESNTIHGYAGVTIGGNQNLVDGDQDYGVIVGEGG